MRTHVFSFVRLSQLLYMVLESIMQLSMFLIKLSIFLFFQRRISLQTSNQFHTYLYWSSLFLVYLIVHLLERIYPMQFFLFPHFTWINIFLHLDCNGYACQNLILESMITIGFNILSFDINDNTCSTISPFCIDVNTNLSQHKLTIRSP